VGERKREKRATRPPPRPSPPAAPSPAPDFGRRRARVDARDLHQVPQLVVGPVELQGKEWKGVGGGRRARATTPPLFSPTSACRPFSPGPMSSARSRRPVGRGAVAARAPPAPSRAPGSPGATPGARARDAAARSAGRPSNPGPSPRPVTSSYRVVCWLMRWKRRMLQGEGEGGRVGAADAGAVHAPPPLLPLLPIRRVELGPAVDGHRSQPGVGMDGDEGEPVAFGHAVAASI